MVIKDREMNQDREQFIGVSGSSPTLGSIEDMGGSVDRGYGRENPNRRVDFAPTLNVSRRAQRRNHIDEIAEHVSGPARIGKINRFR